MDPSEKEIRQLIADLNERKKELTCLYDIKQKLRNDTLPLDQVFQSIVDSIPPGWQYPEICVAKIIYEDKIYMSEKLQNPEHTLTYRILVENSKLGEIAVYYSQPVDTSSVCAFLPEEHKLLSTIADEIGQYLTLRRLHKLVKEDESISSKFNIPIGLSKWLSDMKLSGNEIEEFLAHKISFKKGESLIKQGSFSTYVVLLSKGLAKAYLDNISSRNYIFKIIKPFDLIGMSSIYGQGGYSFSVSALHDCEGYLIEQKTIDEIISKNNAFCFEIFKWYSSNFQLVFDKINSLANKNTLGRIANTLLYLSNNVYSNSLIESAISRTNIANMSGMSLESAVRILSELKHDNVIKTTKPGIEIINEEILKTFNLAG